MSRDTANIVDRILIHSEFDCKGLQSRDLQRMAIYRDGKSESMPLESSWKSPPPESLMEMVMDAVCALKIDRGTK